nr:MAG TPA: hypothetical protein [Bacteriophage sp.]
MIVEDIVNELDKFIAKYKENKTTAEQGQSLRTKVKEALAGKGVQNTDSLDDSAIIEAVKSLSSNGGANTGTSANFNIENLKFTGLLPKDFSKESVSEEDLVKINDTIIKDTKIISSAENILILNKKTGVNVGDGVALTSLEQKLLDKNKQYVGSNYYNFKVYNLPVEMGDNKFTVTITNNGISRDKDISITVTTELYAKGLIKIQFKPGEGFKLPGAVDRFVKYVDEYETRPEMVRVSSIIKSYSSLYSTTSVGMIKNLRNNIVKSLSIGMNFDVSANDLATQNSVPSSESAVRYSSIFFGKSGNSLRFSRTGSMYLFRVDGNNDNIFTALDYKEGDTVEMLIGAPLSGNDYSNLIPHYESISEHVKDV